MEPFTPGAIA